MRHLLVIVMLMAPVSAQTLPPAPVSDAQRLPLLLRKLDHTFRCLVVTAHPDDEDGGLMAWLGHGEGIDVSLLSLTRGEGGQNELGDELHEALAALRTRELEAAHTYDGARQLFGNAPDFGYSFSVEETFEKWGPEPVLRDIVRVLREYRPDVVITLTPTGAGGGQHHQASARLAQQAVEIASGARWPELGAAHQVRRVFRQAWAVGPITNRCLIDLDRHDPVLGTTWAEIGRASRAMHKCQGMVRLPSRARKVSRLEWMWASGEEPRPVKHPFEGLSEPLLDDPSGNPTRLGRLLREKVAALRQAFSVEAPHATFDGLQELSDWLLRSPSGRAVFQRIHGRLDEAAVRAAGVRLTATARRGRYAPGEPVQVDVAVYNAGDRELNLKLQLEAPRTAGRPGDASLILAPGARKSLSLAATVESARPGITATGLRLGCVLSARRSVFIASFPVDHLAVTPRALRRSDVHVVPDPSLRPAARVVSLPAPAGRERTGTIEFLVSSLSPRDVEVRPAVPDGWTVAPAGRALETPGEGIEVPVRFALTAPTSARAVATITATVTSTVGGRTTVGSRGYRVIDYPHIRPEYLIETAEVRCVPFDCAPPARRRVGYVRGTGDVVADCLRTLGLEVDELDGKALESGDLDAYGAIVLGVRAYKDRRDLRGAQPRLMDWVRTGGTLIVQYNKFELNAGAEKGCSLYVPYPAAAVSRRRVTVEEAPVTLTDPEHPLFRVPNRLHEADWSGWVQERGLYFLDVRDERYRDLVTLQDPWPYNPGMQGGALVEAEVGRGKWIYVGLGLFRQLPAGVPGAWRLLSNLLSR